MMYFMSLLEKYVYDAKHVNYGNAVQVEPKGKF